jgi:hypothetical protein
MPDNTFPPTNSADDPHPSEAYPAIDQAFAEGWNDPKMDDYECYEELKK